jgi:hypothetical protein
MRENFLTSGRENGNKIIGDTDTATEDFMTEKA